MALERGKKRREHNATAAAAAAVKGRGDQRAVMDGNEIINIDALLFSAHPAVVSFLLQYQNRGQVNSTGGTSENQQGKEFVAPLAGCLVSRRRRRHRSRCRRDLCTLERRTERARKKLAFDKIKRGFEAGEQMSRPYKRRKESLW